jgi:hypothetical protein
MITRAIVIGSLALLGACEMKVGKDEEGAKAAPATQKAADAPAAGKAEQGQFTMKGPGFDMKIDIPKDVASRADADGDNDLLYPGASISGMHIEAAQPSSGVEMRFATPDAPQKVAAWYRDPARDNGFQIRSASQDGEAVLISGTQKSDGDSFSVRLSPAAGGGTDGRLTLSDRQ